MDVPDDEDGLIRFVTEKFGFQRDYYTSLDAVMTDINTQTVH